MAHLTFLCIVAIAIGLLWVQQPIPALKTEYRMTIGFLGIEAIILFSYQVFSAEGINSPPFLVISGFLLWVKFLLFFQYVAHVYHVIPYIKLPFLLSLVPALGSVVLLLVYWSSEAEWLLLCQSVAFAVTFCLASVWGIVLLVRLRRYRRSMVFSIFLLAITLSRIVAALVFQHGKHLLEELAIFNGISFLTGLVLFHAWRIRYFTKFGKKSGQDLLPSKLHQVGSPSVVSADTIRKSLSVRERETVLGLIQGKSYKDVALELNLALNTVKRHANSAYKKLGVSKRGELADLFDSLDKP